MNYIISKEQYLAVKAAWKQQKPQSSIILYNILRGYSAQRGYTPITNPRKLACGAKPWQGYESDVRSCKYEFTEPKLTPYNAKSYDRRMNEYKNLLKPYGLEYSPELWSKIKEILDAS